MRKFAQKNLPERGKVFTESFYTGLSSSFFTSFSAFGFFFLRTYQAITGKRMMIATNWSKPPPPPPHERSHTEPVIFIPALLLLIDIVDVDLLERLNILSAHLEGDLDAVVTASKFESSIVKFQGLISEVVHRRFHSGEFEVLSKFW